MLYFDVICGCKPVSGEIIANNNVNWATSSV